MATANQVERPQPSGTAPPRASRIVSIIGMHRSATSSVARILSLLGFDLGNPQDLIPAAPDNPRGFFENRPLVLTNDRLLRVLGGTWDAPPDLSDGWHGRSTVGALRGPAGHVFDRVLEVAGPEAMVAWKDPRACLLLPFWQEVLAARTDDHRVVHVTRHPDEVVRSLGVRNDFSPEHAARLWVRYVTDALAHAPGALVIDQRTVFGDLDDAIDRLRSHTGLDAPDAGLRDAVGQHLDPGLLHGHGHRAPDGPWVSLARNLHESLQAREPIGSVVAAGRAGADEILRRGTGTTRLLVAGRAPSRRLGPLGHRTSRSVVCLPEASAADRYAWQSDGWEVLTVPASAALRARDPETAFLSDVGTMREVVNTAVVHCPSTRVITHEDSPLAKVADETVALDADAAVGLLTDAVARGRIRSGRKPRVAIVPTTPTRRDVVSVVIPVHGKWPLTEACLDALGRHTSRPLEIVVVDDASPDDTRERLAQRDDVDHVVALDDNVGFPTAVNRGLCRTSGATVCVLNNDTEVTAGWLPPLLDALAIPGTAMAGPRTNRVFGAQAIGQAPGFEAADSASLHGWAARWRAARPPVAWQTHRLVGFCLVARRELFEQLGGLDEGVGQGNYEDDELCARVRDHGYSCRVAEQSVVLHHGSATFRNDSAEYLAALLTGARHTEGRLRRDAPTTTAVVLADADPQPAVATAIRALALTEAAEIWCLDDRFAKEIAHVLPSTVRLRCVDWRDDQQAQDAVSLLPSPRLLVLGPGEQLGYEDAALAKWELETSPRSGLAGPAEARLVAATAAGLAGVGTPTAEQLQHVWISRA